MLYNELPTAFPWYDKKEKQDRYKRNAVICDYKLTTPKNALLPFEFRRTSIKKRPITWKIYDINTDNLIVDISAQISKIRYKTIGLYDYFTYNGAALGTLDLTPGFYYSVITFSGGVAPFYSEMFNVPLERFGVQDVTIKYLKLTWWHSEDLNPFYYSDIVSGNPYFKNVVYLDSFIHDSEPEIFEDGTKDGTDQVIPTFQKMSVKYTVSDLVPNFLKVALVSLQLHDNVFLTDSMGYRSGFITNVTTNTASEANGALSSIDISFNQDFLIIKTGCQNSIGEDFGTLFWV